MKSLRALSRLESRLIYFVTCVHVYCTQITTTCEAKHRSYVHKPFTATLHVLANEAHACICVRVLTVGDLCTSCAVVVQPNTLLMRCFPTFECDRFIGILMSFDWITYTKQLNGGKRNQLLEENASKEIQMIFQNNFTFARRSYYDSLTIYTQKLCQSPNCSHYHLWASGELRLKLN